MAAGKSEASAAPLRALDPALDREVEAILEEQRIPGAAIAVVRGDESYLKPWGVRRAGGSERVTETTAFDIGSCSKAFTTTAAALLAAEGRLRFEDPIREFVPELEYRDPWMSEQATVRDLLTNRVGLARHLPLEYFMNGDVANTELLRRTRFVPQGVPFRDRLAYSNHGFVAVSLAIERISGMPYGRFLEERLFGPLGMRHSASGRRAFEILAERAEGHTLVEDRITPIGEPGFDNYEGAGCVFCCATDAARWLQFHLSRGRVGDQVLVPEQLMDELHAPQAVIQPADRNLAFCPPDALHACYAYGWASSDFCGRRLVQHGGAMAGFRAQTAFLPEEGIGVAVYLSVADDVMAAISYHLLERLLGRTPLDWPGLARAASEQASRQMAALVGFAVPCQEGAPHSLDLSSYAGRYGHPGAGTVRVVMEKDRLVLQLLDARIWDSALVHLGEEVFELQCLHQSVADNLPAPLRMRFELEDGRVCGFRDLWGERYQRVQDPA